MALSKRCKQLLCILYAVFLFLTGVVLIIYSIFLGYKLGYYFKFVQSESLAPFTIILLLALGHIVLTWFGVKGLRNEYLFYVFLFMAITLAFLISEIATGVWALVLMGKLNEKSSELMKSSFEEFIKSNYTFDKLDWIRLQSQFACCGINGVADYTVLGSIPISCCAASTTACTAIYQFGCKDHLVQYFKQLLLHIALAGFGSALFQILGLVAFFQFYKAVKQENSEASKRRASALQEINPLNRRQTPKSRNQSLQKEMPSKP